MMYTFFFVVGTRPWPLSSPFPDPPRGEGVVSTTSTMNGARHEHETVKNTRHSTLNTQPCVFDDVGMCHTKKPPDESLTACFFSNFLSVRNYFF